MLTSNFLARLSPRQGTQGKDRRKTRSTQGRWSILYTTIHSGLHCKNTVSKLIEGKKPKDISNIRIVDPACGSGSFLIGAYQHLLDYHRDYYTENGKTSKGTKDNPLTPDGYLTTEEKKRILLNNIYGVDIDVNAVEVTKLSLLLKCMEGETEASIATQQKLFNDRILPTLDDNVKSGNSLIDTDFYDGQLDFEPQVEKKIKPFNWQKHSPKYLKMVASMWLLGIHRTD